MNRRLQNIIDSNEIAVTQYQHGYNHQAILSWASILRSITGKSGDGRSYTTSSSSNPQEAAGLLCGQDGIARQEAQLNANGTTESHVREAPSRTTKESSYFVLHSRYPITETMSRTVPHTNNYNEMYSEIFNGAFHIPKDDHIQILLEENDIAIVLSYNLGLLLHRQGIQKGNTSFLSKAARLYEEALMLTQEQLQKDGRNVDSSDDGSLRLYYAILTAAACCNLAHVCRMFLIKPSKGLVHQLIMAVKVMESKEAIISNQYDMKFFHVAIFLLNQGLFITAPTA